MKLSSKTFLISIAVVLATIFLLTQITACLSQSEINELNVKREAQKTWDREHPAQVAEKNYQVSFLFEYDGCKIYRFYDMSRYHYWVVDKNKALTITTQEYKHGKTTEYQEENVITKEE